MKNINQEVWAGVDSFNDAELIAEQAKQEFVSLPIAESLTKEEAMDTQTNRRDFLKYLGFGLGAATIAASCEIPVKRAIPYVTKPDSIVPGVANYYASSFVNGGDYCAVLVKTREGRPIKIEGNDLSSITMGGTSARTQASVLSLYDVNRIQYPGTIANNKVEKMTWAALDTAIKSKLANGNVRILANTILSPSTKRTIADFTSKYTNAKLVMYDPVSASALLAANEQSFGDRSIPDYKFDTADYIVSFNADFLGTWVSPIEYAAKYAKKRKLEDAENAHMSRHIQVESNMSMTGSNADNRILVKPSEQGAAIALLYSLVSGANVSTPKINEKATKAITKLAADLVANKGKSIVISGSNNTSEQVLVNAINASLGNYGATIDFANASLQRQGSDADLQSLIGEMKSGQVGSLIILGANPVFDLANGEEFKAAMSKVTTKISFASVLDETSLACNYVAPNNHFLESWGDAEPKRGHYSLIQPTIAPLFDSRQAEISLLTWSDKFTGNYMDYVKASWQNMFKGQNTYSSFQSFWDSKLHDGVYEVGSSAKATNFKGDVNTAIAGTTKPASTPLEISFFETVNIGHGQYANNPWLMEMPDPVNRCVWGNYLSVPINWDGDSKFKSLNDLNDGDIVELTVNGVKKEVTIVRQFGQMQGTLGLALGYGRTQAGLTGTGVGTHVNPWLSVTNGNTQYFSTNVSIAASALRTDKEHACVQHHHTMGVTGKEKGNPKTINVDEKVLAFQGSLVDRTVIRRTHLDDIKKFSEELKEERHEHQELNSKTLYPGHKEEYTRGHHWGMYVDLNACTGCGTCVVACMSENNVPVVGKREVSRHHEMTWLRIDRYFYGDTENPNTVYQPMMCQHCDNAPCENVCPVNATNHSGEGLNQMAYNRCIGTRYCANNCPYKVRRFNWLDFTTADIFPWNERSMHGEEGIPYGADNLTRMVLNPDVTVRSRGVIEKCSMCVQRIQEGKLTAKKEERQLRDGDVKTACMTACPTGAITFGDKNNPESAISKKLKNPLNYIVLEEVNVASNVMYTAKVINKDEKLEA
jgi:MoCo/4Fe-4S cofactor protein with predicted Tat translocation signal